MITRRSGRSETIIRLFRLRPKFFSPVLRTAKPESIEYPPYGIYGFLPIPIVVRDVTNIIFVENIIKYAELF